MRQIPRSAISVSTIPNKYHQKLYESTCMPRKQLSQSLKRGCNDIATCTPQQSTKSFPKEWGWREGSHSMIRKKLRVIYHAHLHIYHQVYDLRAIKLHRLAFQLSSTSIFPYEIHLTNYTHMRFIPTACISRTLLEQATDPIFSKKYTFLARYIPTLIEAVIYMKP